ncbi:DUF2207 domain-containing protein [Halomicrobium salinisoli]|uniref:DUF2207 domain-containing protein n=1 Tax=Halomicrobium salinisoli TaxID=2878391 RepID=UPI001CF0317F|nr:DUF2207 domain-containing protein [Halomicrobium salinisoli]
MALSAVDSVDDAIDATKRFLLPFSWSTWLKLAFVLFFVGGGGGFTNPQAFSNLGDEGSPDTQAEGFGSDGALQAIADSGPSWLTPELILGAVVALIVLVVVLAVIGQVMQFVFVESLLREEVHVRRYFGRNVGNGLRLLAFRILLGIVAVTILAVIAVAAGVLLFGLGDGGFPAVGAGLLVLAIPLMFLFAIVFGTINGFTNVFVVPIMLTEDRGVLSAWSRLWGAIKREWKEFLAYLFFSVVLTFGVGILAGLLGLFAIVVVGIPFLIVGFAVHAVATGTVGAVALGAVVALFALTALVTMQLIAVPLQSFLRYYALLVLGDVEETLDPIPEIRAGVRSDESPSDQPAA